MSEKAIVNKENQLKENSFIEGGFDYFADTYLYGLFNQNINQSKNKETK
jgi:hypothetical protein